MTKKYKMLEVTISGAYISGSGDVIDFEGIKGVMPFCSEEQAAAAARKRYAVLWVKDAKDSKGEKIHTKRITKMFEVFIDDIKEVTGEVSFIGKDIHELMFEEMQDLATYMQCREIPATKVGSIRQLREKTYKAYSKGVLGKEIKDVENVFNITKAPAIKLADTNKTEVVTKMTMTVKDTKPKK